MALSNGSTHAAEKVLCCYRIIRDPRNLRKAQYTTVGGLVITRRRETGDMRIHVGVIETLMMMWFRSLRPGAPVSCFSLQLVAGVICQPELHKNIVMRGTLSIRATLATVFGMLAAAITHLSQFVSPHSGTRAPCCTCVQNTRETCIPDFQWAFDPIALEVLVLQLHHISQRLPLGRSDLDHCRLLHFRMRPARIPRPIPARWPQWSAHSSSAPPNAIPAHFNVLPPSNSFADL